MSYDDLDALSAMENEGVGDVLDYLIKNSKTMTSDYLNEPGQAHELINDLFPVNHTTAIIGNAGAAKTTYVCAQAIIACVNNPDMEVMIITKEDTEEDYKNKIRSALVTQGINRPHPYEGASIDLIAGRIHVINLAMELDASMAEGFLSTHLVELIKDNYPKVRLVFFETLSHLMGAKLEDTAGMAAIVNHCNRVAMGITGASVITHHQSKQSVQDKQDDLLSSRGGVALAANTRSFIVLTRLSQSDDDEQLVRVKHVRSSYSEECETVYYALKDGCSFAKVFETREDINSVAAKVAAVERHKDMVGNLITEWIREMNRKNKVPTRQYLDRYSIMLFNLKKADWEPVIDDLIESGYITETDKAFAIGYRSNTTPIK